MSAGLPNACRSTTIAFDPTDPTVMYAAASNGTNTTADNGLYKTTNGGQTWTRLGPELPITAVAVSPTNPLLIYTGGTGLRKSTDGGSTWTNLSPGTIGPVSAVVFHPTAPGTVFVGCEGNGNTQGVWKTTDGGTTWTKPLVFYGYTTILFHPTDPSIVYASGGTVHKSTDGGDHWSCRQHGPVGLLPRPGDRPEYSDDPLRCRHERRPLQDDQRRGQLGAQPWSKACPVGGGESHVARLCGSDDGGSVQVHRFRRHLEQHRPGCRQDPGAGRRPAESRYPLRGGRHVAHAEEHRRRSLLDRGEQQPAVLGVLQGRSDRGRGAQRPCRRLCRAARGLLQEHRWREFLGADGHRDACSGLAAAARRRRRSDYAEHGVRRRERQDLPQHRQRGQLHAGLHLSGIVDDQHHDCAERLPGALRRFGERLPDQVDEWRNELVDRRDAHRERGGHTPDRPEHGVCRRDRVATATAGCSRATDGFGGQAEGNPQLHRLAGDQPARLPAASPPWRSSRRSPPRCTRARTGGLSQFRQRSDLAPVRPGHSVGRRPGSSTRQPPAGCTPAPNTAACSSATGRARESRLPRA